MPACPLGSLPAGIKRTDSGSSVNLLSVFYSLDAKPLFQDQAVPFNDISVKPYLLYRNDAAVEYWIPGAFSNETASRVLEGTKKVVNDSNGTGYSISLHSPK